MLAEAIEVIRELWTGQDVTHDGQYFATRRARLFTRPAQPIPLSASTLVPANAARRRPWRRIHHDGRRER
jgi:coenzyme F420-dependent glucose-6-phosphate dehydrogenase